MASERPNGGGPTIAPRLLRWTTISIPGKGPTVSRSSPSRAKCSTGVGNRWICSPALGASRIGLQPLVMSRVPSPRRRKPPNCSVGGSRGTIMSRILPPGSKSVSRPSPASNASSESPGQTERPLRPRNSPGASPSRPISRSNRPSGPNTRSALVPALTATMRPSDRNFPLRSWKNWYAESPSITPICSSGSAARRQPSLSAHAGIVLSAMVMPALSRTAKPRPESGPEHAARRMEKPATRRMRTSEQHE